MLLLSLNFAKICIIFVVKIYAKFIKSSDDIQFNKIFEDFFKRFLLSKAENIDFIIL